MFGFGRHSKEKTVISSFESTFLAIGFSSAEARDKAEEIFDEVKKELLSRSPSLDIYMVNQGAIFSNDPNYMAPRLAAGLTARDVQAFWNRPLVMVMCETKLRELMNFMVIDIARQQGQDLNVVAGNHRKTTPHYGDPGQWNPAAPGNKGFNEQDADIYLEFAGRVEAWRAKTTEKEVDRLVAEHGSFNAMVRDLVSTGAL